jgi:hypothetical protein
VISIGRKRYKAAGRPVKEDILVGPQLSPEAHSRESGARTGPPRHRTPTGPTRVCVCPRHRQSPEQDERAEQSTHGPPRALVQPMIGRIISLPRGSVRAGAVADGPLQLSSRASHSQPEGGCWSPAGLLGACELPTCTTAIVPEMRRRRL